MNFRKRRRDDEPEINLVPMIDILLVVLIFMMVTTTFVKPAALKIRLPGSQNSVSKADGTTVLIRVNAQGLYALEGIDQPLGLIDLKAQLTRRAQATPDAREKLTVMVEADRNATHQQVVDALDSVAAAGLNRVSIVTQKR